MEGTQNSKVNFMNLSVTLTLSMHSGVMVSAYRLAKRNIRVKINKSRSKGSGDMEQARNSKVNSLTLKFDLDLESR